MSEQLESAKRRLDTAAAKLPKVGYLGGSKNEAEFAAAAEAYASLNNTTEGRPFLVLPRKRLRGR